MAKNVEGEFEVLLGNKQLLSIFFIVVILLAVFFTMGYVLGRGTSANVARTAASPPAAREAAPASGFADLPAPAVPAVAETSAKTGTQPQPQAPVEPPPPPPPAAKAQAGPAAGEVYLQVQAVKKAEAEIVASVLKQKGFKVVLAPGPTADVFRVLVGPFSTQDALAKTRAALEAAKFKSFVRKY